MRKSATALVSLGLVALLSPPAMAGPAIHSVPALDVGRVVGAVPPAAPGASGAIIRDPSCFETQLWDGGGSLGSASAVRVDLPFEVYGSGKYWNDIWISPQGALSHDVGGIYASGMDVIEEDMLRSSEVYMPMFGGYSLWDGDPMTDSGYQPSSAYYGFTFFDGHQALCVTWLNITPMIPDGPPQWVVWDPSTGSGYWQSPGHDNDPTHPNSYQALIVDRSDTGWGNFDVVFNYDTITWQREHNGVDSTTGEVIHSYSEAGWSRGIPGEEYEFVWRGEADGRLDDYGEPMMDPGDQLPYPQDHWFPQHDAAGGHGTLLDSSPTGLAVTHTGKTSQVGRHIFPMTAPRWHLALVLDGRASLTPEEYAAQLEAIAAGLADKVAFPTNERFGISVTVAGRYRDPDTYAWVDALTVLPEWTIFSDATMATLEGRIRGIAQSTDSGGSDRVGLGVAVTDTESFLGRRALRSVCQVSFAQPSPGLGSDLDALGSSGGVDRVDLIGIGGQPGGNTGLSSAETDAADHLYGGTGYLYAPTTSDLADEWVGHCAKRLPLIRGMEVNQSVQNLDNDLPLVENRHTVVRIYAEKTFPDDVDPRLIGELTARSANPPYDLLDPPVQLPYGHSFPWITATTASTDPSYRSNITEAAPSTFASNVLDIPLPDSWTTGDVVLSLETNQPVFGSDYQSGVTCTWAHTPAYGPCTIRTTYTPSSKLTVDLFVVTIDGQAPTDAEVSEQLRRVTSMYPISSVNGWDIQAYTAVSRRESPEFWIVATSVILRRISAQARSSGVKPYYYALTNPSDYNLRGMGFRGGAASDVSSWANEQGPEGTGPWRNVMAHELGHAIGLNHDIGSPATDKGLGFWEDLCGTVTIPTMDYPGWTGQAVFASSDGAGSPPTISLPTMSDFSTSAGSAERRVGGEVQYGVSLNQATVFEEYWGLDTRYVGTGFPLLAYSDPRKTGELMSYVNDGNAKCTLDLSNEGQGYWVSPESYLYLWDHLVPAGTSRVAAAGDLVFITMSSDAGGTTAEIGPMIDVPYIDTARGNDLGYVVKLYDGTGALLSDVNPDVDFAANEGGDPTTHGYVVADFPRQDVARIDLVQDDVVIASNVATPATPVVEITSPADGATIAGDVVHLAWSASDADGDALEFDVLYSPDGSDWDEFETGLTGNGVDIDRSQLTGSMSGQFLVVVNDGFNSSTDTVGGLNVADNPPWILIGDPVDSSSFQGDQEIPFTAWVSDREDGSIPFADVTWESSLDGPLDAAAPAGVLASDLTTGVHRIAASVTDSKGHVSTATTTITILGDEVAPPETPGSGTSGGTATPEPSPSASPSPQPSPRSGVGETPGPGPSPSTSPGGEASGPTEATSGAWLWVIGLTLLVLIAAAAAGSWHRRRPSRDA